MTGTMFDLKPCHSRSTRLDRSSQLIWVDPNVVMYSVNSQNSEKAEGKLIAVPLLFCKRKENNRTR